MEWIDTYIAPRKVSNTTTDWLGPGDDAALLPCQDQEHCVLTVDALVEGQHFHHDWLDDQGLARRLLRSSVSDLTAMGAEPRGVLISIETSELPGRVGDDFWQSIDQECQLLNLKLLGGNVARTTGPLALHATCAGSVGIGREWRRTGASVGDLLLVSGAPGRACQARERIEQGNKPPGEDHWTCPQPRWLFARALSNLIEQEMPDSLPSAIDISDGLLLDLKRLCQSNHCGAQIDIESLTRSVDSPSARQILSGGEDYELLMAIPASMKPLVQIAAKQTETEFHEIGLLTAATNSEIEVLNGLQPWDPEKLGWDPFVEEPDN